MRPGKMLRRAVSRRPATWAVAALWLCMGAGSYAQSPVASAPGAPSKPWVVGGQTLRASAHAVRVIDSHNVYSITFALPRLIGSVQAARQPDIPKAFRVDIMAGAAKVHEAWRDELLPALSPAEEDMLRKAYADLAPGDRLAITFAPGAGTTVKVDGRAVLQQPGAGLIDAYTQLWFYDQPLSRELQRSLHVWGRRGNHPSLSTQGKLSPAPGKE